MWVWQEHFHDKATICAKEEHSGSVTIYAGEESNDNAIIYVSDKVHCKVMNKQGLR